MKNNYKLLLGLACALVSGNARAQYTFTDSNLNPYRQDFNGLAGTVAVTDNQLNSLPEVYAEAEFGTFRFTPAQAGGINANDGNTAAANYYHFGYNSSGDITNRALGGIGGFLGGGNTTPGVGYVGIRFKNGSTKTITNLEIKYAMEHWYNSTFSTAAKVTVSYLKGTALTSLRDNAGTWTTLPDLEATAPSTSTSVGGRDGNTPSNRRVLSTTLPVSLAAGQEVLIRWAYVLNSNTNGNGLSIDDVVVTPQTNVFYSKMNGDLNDLGNWGQNTDGTGMAPTSFTAANQTFFVQSTSSTAANDRIGAMNSSLGSNWTVSGLNSKIVVGSPTAAAALMVASGKNITGTIDVGNNSFFQHNQPNSPAFTLGTLAASSTVEYVQSARPLIVQANQYGTLKISGNNLTGTDRSSNQKVLSGNVIVVKNLSIFNGSNLVLGNYDLTVLNSATVTGGATAYVVTNGTGRLRIAVPRASNATTAGALRTFPVGSSVTSYTPVTLQQTSTTSDDVFEVRAVDGIYTTYNASTYAPGPTAVTTEAVKKTWLISREVTANPATVNMTLQWTTSEATSDFVSTRAHINHYDAGKWDVYMGEVGTSTSIEPFVATRRGISSFSPFSVSSRANGALPVELVSFDAKRTDLTVTCAWATASERNNDYFTVERSANGEQFAAIGTVKGAGSTTKASQYRFVDKTPPTGLAYYRLRQTDLDGTVSFSPVVAVQGGSPGATATAVPNPSTGRFDIWTLAADVTATEVTTVVGARLLVQPTTTTSGFLAFDLSAQPAGLYFVHLRTKTGTQVVRVVKN